MAALLVAFELDYHSCFGNESLNKAYRSSLVSADMNQ